MVNITQNETGEQVDLYPSGDVIKLGLVADTHIPDRIRTLHPSLLDGLVREQVDLICHCGDITQQRVLDELGTIAPVLAVMGNRDLFFSSLRLPFTRSICVFNKTIGLFHGFASIRHYFLDKLHYIRHGYQFDYYRAIGNQLFPSADILIYGHTHYAESRTYPDQVVINPGTVSPNTMSTTSSWATLILSKQGETTIQFHPLTGWQSNRHRWQPNS